MKPKIAAATLLTSVMALTAQSAFAQAAPEAKPKVEQVKKEAGSNETETAEQKNERLFEEQKKLIQTPKGQMLYQTGMLAATIQTLRLCKNPPPVADSFEALFKKQGLIEYTRAGGTEAEFNTVYDGAKNKIKDLGGAGPDENTCKKLAHQLSEMEKAVKQALQAQSKQK